MAKTLKSWLTRVAADAIFAVVEAGITAYAAVTVGAFWGGLVLVPVVAIFLLVQLVALSWGAF